MEQPFSPWFPSFSYPDPNRDHYLLDDTTESALRITARKENGILVFAESGEKGRIEFGHECLWIIIKESTDERFTVGNHCYEGYSSGEYISESES